MITLEDRIVAAYRESPSEEFLRGLVELGVSVARFICPSCDGSQPLIAQRCLACGHLTGPRPNPLDYAGASYAVADHARALGWQVLDREVRWREGSLGLIAIDGDTIVFADVVFRPNGGTFTHSERHMRLLARRWLVDELRRPISGGPEFSELRFDRFIVTVHETGWPVIEHLQSAF